jgi:hypothetical protein
MTSPEHLRIGHGITTTDAAEATLLHGQLGPHAHHPPIPEDSGELPRPTVIPPGPAAGIPIPLALGQPVGLEAIPQLVCADCYRHDPTTTEPAITIIDGRARCPQDAARADADLGPPTPAAAPVTEHVGRLVYDILRTGRVNVLGHGGPAGPRWHELSPNWQHPYIEAAGQLIAEINRQATRQPMKPPNGT